MVVVGKGWKVGVIVRPGALTLPEASGAGDRVDRTSRIGPHDRDSVATTAGS
jgi:hypothetical protein